MEDEAPDVPYHLITHRLTSEDESQFWPPWPPGPGPPATRCSPQQLAARTVKKTGGEFGGVTGVVCATQSPANE